MPPSLAGTRNTVKQSLTKGTLCCFHQQRNRISCDFSAYLQPWNDQACNLLTLQPASVSVISSWSCFTPLQGEISCSEWPSLLTCVLIEVSSSVNNWAWAREKAAVAVLYPNRSGWALFRISSKDDGDVVLSKHVAEQGRSSQMKWWDQEWTSVENTNKKTE